MNLSKVVGNFVEEQKTINAQINQRIEKVESLNNQQQVHEKGRFPSQTLPNPRGVHELNCANEPTPKMDEVQVIITLRSGKEIEQPMPKSAGKIREQEEEEAKYYHQRRFDERKYAPSISPSTERQKEGF